MTPKLSTDTKKQYVEDLLTPEQLKRYNELAHEEAVVILYNALKKKLETDPDYEVWVPLVYFKYAILTKDNEHVSYNTKHVFISSKGRVDHIRKQTKSEEGHVTSNGYMRFNWRMENGPSIGCQIHRAVACCFVPKPDRLKDQPYHVLEANHLDTVKTHNDFTNLEWCTSKENSVHSVQNGLRTYTHGSDHYAVKPVLGEVILPGKYEGVRFIRSGKREIEELLGDGGNVAGALAGTLKQVKGCKWSYATAEDIVNYGNAILEPELMALIKNHNSNWREPIIGKRISDGHLLFIDGGPKQMHSLGFNSQGIYNCCNGAESTYKGYVFHRATSPEEIATVKAQIAKQITEHVIIEFKKLIILGTRVSDNHRVIFNGSKEMQAAGWIKSTVYRAVKEPGKVIHGWTFTKAESDEEVAAFQLLIDNQITTL